MHPRTSARASFVHQSIQGGGQLRQLGLVIAPAPARPMTYLCDLFCGCERAVMAACLQPPPARRCRPGFCANQVSWLGALQDS